MGFMGFYNLADAASDVEKSFVQVKPLGDGWVEFGVY